MDRAKPFCISKGEVWEAYKRVRANQGAAGVDGQFIAEFEEDLKNNLFKIWDRMSSGSYFPPVCRVEIPKYSQANPFFGIELLDKGTCNQCPGPCGNTSMSLMLPSVTPKREEGGEDFPACPWRSCRGCTPILTFSKGPPQDLSLLICHRL